MKKHLLLSVVVVALGLSACNDDAFPTGAERDLLTDPGGTPMLGSSAYASALDVFLTETGVLKDTIRIQPPTPPWKPGDPRPPGTVRVHENDETTGNFSQYVPSGWDHIADEHNRSSYKPPGYEHIKEGANATNYKPGGWVHYGGPPNIDNTKYLPPGYVHIASGPNESKYRKPVTPVDTATPIGPIGVH